MSEGLQDTSPQNYQGDFVDDCLLNARQPVSANFLKSETGVS